MYRHRNSRQNIFYSVVKNFKTLVVGHLKRHPAAVYYNIVIAQTITPTKILQLRVIWVSTYILWENNFDKPHDIFFKRREKNSSVSGESPCIYCSTRWIKKEERRAIWAIQTSNYSKQSGFVWENPFCIIILYYIIKNTPCAYTRYPCFNDDT